VMPLLLAIGGRFLRLFVGALLTFKFSYWSVA